MGANAGRSGRFRASTTWVIDFRYDGRSRRWFRTVDDGVDVRARLGAELAGLYGDHARLVDVRPATADEEAQYLRGDAPKNVLCPTGRGPRGDSGTP
jgi:hypothetical protein